MYDQIARFYDLTHDSLTDDIPFLLALAAQSGGPALELGCGTGRLVRPFARAGIPITGIDNSAAMLAVARQRLAELPPLARKRVTLVEGDMTQLPVLDGRFPLVIIPYNTFLHLDSPQKLKTLREVKKVLAADGRLVIDLSNPIHLAQTPDDDEPILETSFTDPETGKTIRQFAANRLDEAGQVLHIDWVYEVDGGERTAVPADYYYLFPHQIELLLTDVGLQMKSIAGGYDGSVFSEESSRLLVTAVPR